MQQQNNSNKVNVLGDANVDMILNLSDKKNLGEPALFSGGSSANVASGLSKLGIDVSFFGSLGNDMYGKHVVDEMKADGIDVSNLELLDNYSTAMVIGVVEDNSERHFFLWPPEKVRITNTHLVLNLQKTYSIVIGCMYQVLAYALVLSKRQCLKQ